MSNREIADGQPSVQEKNLRSLWIALAIGLLILASVIGFDIVQGRAHIDAEERQQLTTQATVVDENLSRRLASASAAIDSIRHDLPWLLAQQNGRFLVNRRLNALVDVMIGARTLIIMDANGEAMASNQNALVGRNFRDGERFQAIRQGRDPRALYVSPPFKTPLGNYALSVGKVLLDENGKFDGVVLAVLDPEFFKTLMNSVRYSSDMRASVIHGDGKIVFSTDDTLDMSKVDLSKQVDSFFNRHLRSGRELSVFLGYIATTKDERLAVLRTIGPDSVSMSKPLVIVISRSRPAIFAQWRQQALIQVALFCLLSVLGMLGMFSYQRRQRAFVRVSLAKEAEHMQAEIIAKSEGFIRTITDALPGLVAYFDKNLRCQFANKAYVDWYGKSPEAIIGNTLMELMGATLFSVNEPHIRAVLAGENQQFERFLTRPDGSVGHVLANYIADFDAAGNIVGFIVVVADIKAFKVAEAELRLAAKVYESVSEAIMVTDVNGIILSVNPAFTDITGYSAQEAIGQTPRLFRSHHHSQEFHAAVWRQISDTGLWQGEIWNRSKTGKVFLEWQTITRIAGTRAGEDRYISVFYDITETWEKNESIKQLAFHDALTKLPNRMLLVDRIERHIMLSERESRSLVLMFLDLDRFKVVNDTLGHAVGDDLLVAVGKKLQGLVRDADTVARFGGDEFVILLDNPANKVEVERIANRIIAVINEPMELQGKMAHVGTSVGIAMYPVDGTTSAALIKSADLAMYEAKKAGRNTYRFASREDDSAVGAAPRLTRESEQ